MKWDERQDSHSLEERLDFEDSVCENEWDDTYDPYSDESFYEYMAEAHHTSDFFEDEDESFDAYLTDARAEQEQERHLTQAFCDALGTGVHLFDFDVFKQAKMGDAEALNKVISYFLCDDEWRMSFAYPGNKKSRQLWLGAIKQAIMRYSIREGDTYFSPTEISRTARSIFEDAMYD